jgi:hypothetical protein
VNQGLENMNHPEFWGGLLLIIKVPFKWLIPEGSNIYSKIKQGASTPAGSHRRIRAKCATPLGSMQRDFFAINMGSLRDQAHIGLFFNP